LVVAEQVEQTTRDYLVATATIRCSAASRQLVEAVAVGATAEAILLEKTGDQAVAAHSPRLVVRAQWDKATTAVPVTQHKKLVAVAVALVVQVG
jgi:hypothetical protein